jgi:uncharacterized protein (DUF305 family)
MTKDNIVFGLVGLFVGIILTGLIASYSVNNRHSGVLRMMGIDSSRLMADNIDKNFIEQMIPHHESAIEMAKLAQQKASRPEIKTLAGDIIASQSDEIIRMRYWYERWYGIEVPKQDTANKMTSMMHNANDIDKLRGAVDFDKAFLEEMIPHHQMAVMMASMLDNATNRQEMKTLAKDIIAAQSKEIDAMRNWQTQWGYVTSEQSSNGMMDMTHGSF